MNNYEERSLGHKRVRMEGEPPSPLVQGNGLPLAYMGLTPSPHSHSHMHSHPRPHSSPAPPAPSVAGAHSPYALTSYLGVGVGVGVGVASSDHHNGHQISYQPYAGSYNAHYPPADVAFGGYGPGGDLAGYASRGLGYAPPAHQAYPPPQTSAFVQQQQQMLHSSVSPYEQQHLAHSQHPAHKSAWAPQPLMQPIQSLDGDPAGLGGQLNDDPPKIKIKTDIFKEAESNQTRRGVITDGGDADKQNAECDLSKIRHIGPDGVETVKKEGGIETNMDMLGGNVGAIDAEGGKSRISDSGNSTDSANKNKFQGFSDSESSSSSEDETKIPNEIYFGTPDVSTYRPKIGLNASSLSIPSMKPSHMTPGMGEVKKRGRPKGSCNKPKPPGSLPGTPRPQVGRPRGGGHSGSFMSHAIRPFKRDFSGIRFKRRFSDDGLDSSHIPNEVYFGDVPVSMEILFNYHDIHAERDKSHGHHKVGHRTPGNVHLVYSSSDSSDDDSSDDSSDTDNEPDQSPIKRGPGRPRGSKTVNRRSDGQRLSSEANSPGDNKPPGITEMKRFLKIAGIEYDYAKLVEGCISNKERVAALLGLLEAKGLKEPPTVEACRALYSGPPPRRRGPKPGTKRTPKTSITITTEPGSPKSTPSDEFVAVSADEDSRRVTRGQTSGKPRQRIVISSDEEDAHTPLSKLRTMR